MAVLVSSAAAAISSLPSGSISAGISNSASSQGERQTFFGNALAFRRQADATASAGRRHAQLFVAARDDCRSQGRVGGMRFVRRSPPEVCRQRQQQQRCSPRSRQALRATMTAPWAAFDFMAAGMPAGFVGGPRPWGDQQMPMGGFARFLNDMLRDLPRGMLALQGWGVQEGSDAFMLRVELPGFGAEDVSVQVEDDRILRITAKSNAGEEAGDMQGPFFYKRAGGLQARLPLSDNVNIDAITAELKNGILSIVLPKLPTESPKTRVVPINIAAAAVQPPNTESETAQSDVDISVDRPVADGRKSVGQSNQSMDVNGDQPIL